MLKQHTVRTILSLLLSFFLCLSLVGLCIFAEGETAIVGKRNFRDHVKASNYINAIEKQVNQQVCQLLLNRKVDPACAEELLNGNRIYVDAFNYINTVFSGKEGRTQSLEFREGLSSAIKDYLEKNKVSDSANIDLIIKEIVSQAESYYETYVTPDFVSTFYAFSNSLNHKLICLAIVSGILAILILVLLFHMYHSKVHAMAYLIYAGITAVLINGLIAISIRNGDFASRLNIGPPSYAAVINEMVRALEKQCYVVTGIMAGLVVLLISIKQYCKSNLYRK
ncbi:MAG: hypothetical protein Q4F05_13625 [bacterium]|nr:hypothetical protein [bacterium]